MAEQPVNPEEKPETQRAQLDGNQSQQVVAQESVTGSQPPSDETLVELPDGEKVAYGELKKQRMMEADYRKKTAELAEERRRLDAERRAREEANAYGPEAYGEDEEVNPIQAIAERQARLEAVLARQYLDSEITRLSGKYPNADHDTVRKLCWSNPQTNIEEEMARDNARITGIQSSRRELSQQELEELEKKAIEKYLAKKGQATASGGVATGEGSQTIVDPKEQPDSYDACKKKLQEELKITSID